MPGGVKSPGGGRQLWARWHRQQQERRAGIFHARDPCGSASAAAPRGCTRRPAPRPELAALGGLAAARGVVTPRARCLVLREMPPRVRHAGAVCLGFSFPRLLGTSLLLNEIFPFLATSRARAGLRVPRGAGLLGPCPLLQGGLVRHCPLLPRLCQGAGGRGRRGCVWSGCAWRPGEGCWGGRGAADASFGLRFGYWASAAPARPPHTALPGRALWHRRRCLCRMDAASEKWDLKEKSESPGMEPLLSPSRGTPRPRHLLRNGHAAGSSAQRPCPGLETPGRGGTLRAALLLPAHDVKANPSAPGSCPWPCAVLLVQSCCWSCSRGGRWVRAGVPTLTPWPPRCPQGSDRHRSLPRGAGMRKGTEMCTGRAGNSACCRWHCRLAGSPLPSAGLWPRAACGRALTR